MKYVIDLEFLLFPKIVSKTLLKFLTNMDTNFNICDDFWSILDLIEVSKPIWIDFNQKSTMRNCSLETLQIDRNSGLIWKLEKILLNEAWSIM